MAYYQVISKSFNPYGVVEWSTRHFDNKTDWRQYVDQERNGNSFHLTRIYVQDAQGKYNITKPVYIGHSMFYDNAWGAMLYGDFASRSVMREIYDGPYHERFKLPTPMQDALLTLPIPDEVSSAPQTHMHYKEERLRALAEEMDSEITFSL